MTETTMDIRLTRRGDEVLCKLADGKESPVKVVWARPLSARGRQVSLVGPDKSEVAMVESLDLLDAPSRKIAEEALKARYLIPRITRVKRAAAHFGVRYWHVETDLGERTFALKNAAKNVVWLTDDHMILRDTLGCRYEITSLSALDVRSQVEVERVI